MHQAFLAMYVSYFMQLTTHYQV